MLLAAHSVCEYISVYEYIREGEEQTACESIMEGEEQTACEYIREGEEEEPRIHSINATNNKQKQY